MQVATIRFTDRDSGDEAMAIVRVEGEIDRTCTVSQTKRRYRGLFWQARIGTADRGVAEGASRAAGCQAGGVRMQIA